MIVDCHTHLGREEQWGRFFRDALGQTEHGRFKLGVTPEDHWAAIQGVDRAIVFGINAIAFEMCVPDEKIAAYVASHSDKLIGFMSVDPNDPAALERLEHGAGTLGLRGIKMSPVYQNYHPLDRRAQRIYRRAEQLGLPILVHAARQFMSGTPMKYANPILFDEVAQLFPDLRIILAHLGMPWFGDTAVVLRKHPNVYSDVSGVVKQPWGFYNALVLMSENGALDKLLFGSDIPFVSPESTMQALRNVNAVTTGTGLPRIPAEAIEHIIHRDTLGLLGLNRSLSPGRD